MNNQEVDQPVIKKPFLRSAYSRAVSNKSKSFWLIVGFFAFIFLIAFIVSKFLYISEEGIYLLFTGAFGFSLLDSSISYFWGDKIVLFQLGAKELKKEEAKNLFSLVNQVVLQFALPMPHIYLINTSSMNAFATGTKPSKASICLTTGLLEKLNEKELKGVIAHELSHVRNYDTRLMVLASALVGGVVLLVRFIFRGGFISNSDDNENRGGNPVFFIIGIIFLILAPLISQMIQLALSRKREYLADAEGAWLTNNPIGLASALEKISQESTPFSSASGATAHLFIANPLKKDRTEKPSFFQELFSTHPPIQKRIAYLKYMVSNPEIFQKIINRQQSYSKSFKEIESNLINQ